MNEKEISLDTPIDKITFTVLDTETTGTNPGEGHEIVEIGMVHYGGRKVTDNFESLIRPTHAMSLDAAKTHRIPLHELRKAPCLDEVIDSIVCFIGDTVIAAHNVNFDMTYLHTSLRKAGRPILENWAIDTILLSQKLWPELKCHCLICMGSALNLPHKGTHRALEDVFATTELLDRIVCEMAARGKPTLSDLHPFRRDYTWREGDIYQELERNLRCAIRRKALVHLYSYDNIECIYFRQTVEPFEILQDGSLLARALGEEKPRVFPLYNIMKVTPTYKE